MKWHSHLSLIASGIGVGWLAGLSVSPVVSIIITGLVGAATAVIAAMSGLEASKDKAQQTDRGSADAKVVNPLPLAILIGGIFVGSILGIRARNQSWMGSTLSEEIQKWTVVGLNRTEIAQRLFDLEYPHLRQAGNLPPLASQATTTSTLTTEIKMWTTVGLQEEEVVRRLFEITYPMHNSDTNPLPAKNPPGIQGAPGLYLHETTDCISLAYYLLPTANNVLTMTDAEVLRRHVEATQFRGLVEIIEDPMLLKKVLEELCKPGY